MSCLPLAIQGGEPKLGGADGKRGKRQITFADFLKEKKDPGGVELRLRLFRGRCGKSSAFYSLPSFLP